MAKLIGYNEMKKTTGKVLFLVDENGASVGHCGRMEFFYGDNSKGVTSAMIGKDVDIVYRRGYDGKAYVDTVTVR